MTLNLNKLTKAELLAHIEEIETEHKYAIDVKNDDIEELEDAIKSNDSALRKRIDNFAEAIQKPYPDLHRNLMSALDNQLFWVDDPPTGFITAKIPPGTSHARWCHTLQQLEFKHCIDGRSYWAHPIEYSEEL